VPPQPPEECAFHRSVMLRNVLDCTHYQHNPYSYSSEPYYIPLPSPTLPPPCCDGDCDPPSPGTDQQQLPLPPTMPIVPVVPPPAPGPVPSAPPAPSADPAYRNSPVAASCNSLTFGSVSSSSSSSSSDITTSSNSSSTCAANTIDLVGPSFPVDQMEDNFLEVLNTTRSNFKGQEKVIQSLLRDLLRQGNVTECIEYLVQRLEREDREEKTLTVDCSAVKAQNQGIYIKKKPRKPKTTNLVPPPTPTECNTS